MLSSEEEGGLLSLALADGDVLQLPAAVTVSLGLGLLLELRVTVIDSELEGTLVSLALTEGDTLTVATDVPEALRLGLPVEEGEPEPVRVASSERVLVEDTLGLREGGGETVPRPEPEGDLEPLEERVPVVVAVVVRLLVVESLKLCVAVVVEDSEAAADADTETDVEEDPLGESDPVAETLGDSVVLSVG